MARVHAGPLCRLFAGAAGDPARLRAGVLAWRQDLQAGLPPGTPPLDWDEAPDGPDFTADLGASGWDGLRLLALYAERPDLELPSAVPPLLELDPVWRAASAARFAKSRFAQLLACRAWLPADFAFTVRAALPDGEEAELGSLLVLEDQLGRLDDATFQGGVSAIPSWLELPAGPGGELLAAARRGFAGLWQAVAWAAERRLPAVVN